MGKTILLYKGGKSLELNDEVVEYGAYNVMKHLGMHEGVPQIDHKSVIVKKSKWIRAQHSGIFEIRIKNENW